MVGSGYSNPEPEPRRPPDRWCTLLVPIPLQRNRQQDTYLFWRDRPKRCSATIAWVLVQSWRRGESRIRRRLGLLLWRQGLPVGTIQHNTLRVGTTRVLGGPQVRVGGMGRNERLRLRRDGSEHALLVKADAIAATSILGMFETGTPNLSNRKRWCQQPPSNVISGEAVQFNKLTLRRRQ